MKNETTTKPRKFAKTHAEVIRTCGSMVTSLMGILTMLRVFGVL
jgi:hypothetical protein